MVFARGTAKNQNRCVIPVRRCLNHRLFRHHFFLKPGFAGPALSRIEGMILQPFLIGFSNLLIQLKAACSLQTFPDACHIIHIDKTARSGAALKIIKLRASKHGQLCSLRQGKGLFVVL